MRLAFQLGLSVAPSLAPLTLSNLVTDAPTVNLFFIFFFCHAGSLDSMRPTAPFSRMRICPRIARLHVRVHDVRAKTLTFGPSRALVTRAPTHTRGNCTHMRVTHSPCAYALIVFRHFAHAHTREQFPRPSAHAHIHARV